MERSLAERIDRLTREASNLVDGSITDVRAGASTKAAGVYTSSIGKVMGEMAVGLLFPIWHEYPDLEPESMKGPGTYNARDFEMAPEVADAALAVLQRARTMMEEVGRLIDQEPDTSARDAYAAELRGVLQAIDDAANGVTRRKAARPTP